MLSTFNSIIDGFQNPPAALDRPLTRSEQISKKVKQFATRFFVFVIYSASFLSISDCLSRLAFKTALGGAGIVCNLALGALFTLTLASQSMPSQDSQLLRLWRFMHYYD